ncbi:MAG: glycosyl hydrolase family 18 protein [bacterium]|nr:glycosyl hydrolase family 18 protein [bacterium]
MKNTKRLSTKISFLLLIIIVGVILILLFKPVSLPKGYKYSRALNGLYIQRSWITEVKSDEDLNNLSELLKELEIKYLFVHHTPFNEDAELPVISYEGAVKFLKVIKEKNKEIKILIWVGGIQKTDEKNSKGTFKLNSAEYQEKVIANCRQFLEDYDFDGLHLNIEPCKNNDKNFLSLLEGFKSALPPEKIISIAAMKPYFLRNPSGNYWSMKYYNQLGKVCNQMVIMGYDTNIKNSKIYFFYIKFAVNLILNSTVSLPHPPSILIGIPAYHPTDKDASKIESIENGIIAVADCFPKLEENDHFEGIAIYSLWTLDQEEINSYLELWLAKKPVNINNLKSLKN